MLKQKSGNVKKRIISILLVVCMLFTLMPVFSVQSNAFVGTLIVKGLSVCKSVISGTVTTAKNLDYYNGDVGKCLLGQFKNIAADLTGSDIGEKYGEEIDSVTLADIKSEMSTISSELQKNNEAIYQLEATVNDGLKNISEQLDEIKQTVTTEASMTRYYTYLTEFFSFFNQYYEGISYYDKQLGYALSGDRSDEYVKNTFDCFYHLENVEYTGNLHSAVDKLGKYLRGEYTSTDPGNVVDVLSRYYILSYKAQGKSDAEAMTLAAADTEAMITYIYYAYCMGVYYEEAVAMYQSAYMQNEGTSEYKTDFGTWITEDYLADSVSELCDSVQDSAGCILGALLSNYPTEALVLTYHTLNTNDCYDGDEYWYNRTVSFDDGFVIRKTSMFYLPDPAEILYSGFSDELKDSLTGCATYATDSGSDFSVTDVCVISDASDTGTRNLYIKVGDKTVKSCTVTLTDPACEDGDGSAEYPYLITKLSDFNVMRNNPNAHFVLGADIDGNGATFDPIKNFSGTFDGNGHKISNLNISEGYIYTEQNAGGTRDTLKSLGFFANLCGTVKNIDFSNICVNIGNGYLETLSDWGDSLYVGTVAGYVAGGTIENCQVKDSTVTVNDIGSSSGATSDTEVSAGGIAGAVFAGGNLNACYNNNTAVTGIVASGFTVNVGGIVGSVGREGAFKVGNTTLTEKQNRGNLYVCAVNNKGEDNGYKLLKSVNLDDENIYNVRLGGLVGSLYMGDILNGAIISNGDMFECSSYSDETGYVVTFAGKIVGYAKTMSRILGNYYIFYDGSWTANDTGWPATLGDALPDDTNVYDYGLDDWNGIEASDLGMIGKYFKVLHNDNDRLRISYSAPKVDVPSRTEYLYHVECPNLWDMRVYSVDGSGYAKGYKCYFASKGGYAETFAGEMYGGTIEGNFTARISLATDAPNTSFNITSYDEHIWCVMGTDATCTEDGSVRKICADCGVATDWETVTALGHDVVIDEAIAPTCKSDGLSEGSHCDRCGEVISAQAVIPAIDHTWYTDVVLDPTCTTGGISRDKCSVCGAYGDIHGIEPTGHSYGETVIAPTCEDPGYTLHKCDTCGDTYTDSYTSALGHVYDSATIVEPTCTALGYTVYTCDCGKSYRDNYTVPYGHDWDIGTITVSPTLTSKGEIEYHCKFCGATKHSELPPLGHCDDGNCPSKNLKDVCDRTFWAHDAIDYTMQLGLFKGVTDSSFEPDTTLTRAMLVVVIYRLEGSPKVGGSSPFTDVPDDKWCADAVIWAAENGIVNGFNDGSFDPNAEISREQMAAIMYRYAVYKGIDVSDSENTDISDWSDASDISAFAVSAMRWAYGEELIKGFGDGTLMPKNSTTRAQAATIIYRFCTNVLNK